MFCEVQLKYFALQISIQRKLRHELYHIRDNTLKDDIQFQLDTEISININFYVHNLHDSHSHDLSVGAIKAK